MLDMVNRKHTNPDKKNEVKSWEWIIIDSLIIGLIAMAAVMPAGIPSTADCWVMFKAWFIAFIFQVAVERGLKPRMRNNN